MSEVSGFRRLPGVPPYGPSAIPFPSEWGRSGHEGLVMEFATDDGNKWVGNFGPGLGGIDDVRVHPNERDVLVTSTGALWQVSPESRMAEEIAPAVFGVWQVADGLVHNHQDIAFTCLGKAGVLWHTRRISWDGFDKLRFEGERLTGQAWSPIEDGWLPFSVDLRTGAVDGGSCTGPEMRFDYLRADRSQA
jgi:hypothetical protein